MPLNFAEYRQLARFPCLDGLRALAVLMVLTAHPGAHAWFPLWTVVDGSMGVPIFFVLSGFLITTLLLREQAARGTASLPAFYVRRVMRLAPAYFLVLAAYLGYVLIGNSEDAHIRRDDLIAKLPYFLLYLNEYARGGSTHVFGHSWSLGIEEKFYLAWPFLAFVVVRTDRARALLAGALAAAFWVSLNWESHVPLFGLSYGALLVGCSLALALHHERPFEMLRRLARRRVQHVVLFAFLLFQFLPALHDARRSPLFALATAGVVATVILGRSSWTAALESPIISYIGRRSYGIYLVHVLCMHLVQRVPMLRQHTATSALAAYAATGLVSVAAAEVLYRMVERPGIRLGRDWSAALQEEGEPDEALQPVSARIPPA